MFEISVYVEHEKEIYNSFDQYHMSLSGDLKDYISDRLAERPMGEKVRFVFSSPETICYEQLDKAFVLFIEEQTIKLEKERKRNLFQSIRLLLIGIFFVVLGILLTPYANVVLSTIISTIGSFSIWEAANRWLIELPRLKILTRIVSFLKDYELDVK